MRTEGTLTKWNDDRGFGFISSIQGGSEIFVHISEFPKDGVHPKLGERILFEVVVDEKGKKRAQNLSLPDRSVMRPPRRATPREKHKKHSLLGRIAPIIVLAIAAYGYTQYFRDNPSETAVATKIADKGESTYSCDGRTHCSQMTSCTEAKYFLKNCPNVQMDGNNDGVPCEQQWCTNFFAK